MAAHANITRRSILKTAGAVSLLGTGVTAAEAIETSHPDAALLLLGEQFEAEWVAYELVVAQYHGDSSQSADDICQTGFDRCKRIVAGIECATARTVDGLRVKARAVQWCFGADVIQFGRGETTDVRISAQIIRALLEA